MRLERDAIGESELSQKDLFGIGTSRLLSAIPAVGPILPVGLAVEILQLRKRQSLEWSAQGVWDPHLVGAFCSAVDRLLSERELLQKQLVVRPLQDSTGRSIVGNLDEIISNLVLLELGANAGEYFRFPSLLQLDVGVRRAEVFATAARIATDKCIGHLLVAIDELIDQLLTRKESAGQETQLIRIQSLPVALYPADTCWAIAEADIHRTRSALIKLRDTFPISAVGGPSNEICEADYYQRLGNELAVLLSRLAQLGNYCKMLLDNYADSKWPRLRSPDALNPNYQEPLYSDFVCQACLCAQSKLWLVSQIRLQSMGDLEAFVPIVAVELYDVLFVAEALCRLLGKDWLPRLPQLSVLQREETDAAPLHAERLIPLIGFDRSVQVARMSALTGKTVRSVVEKMKVLTPEQLEMAFPVLDAGNKKGDCL